MLDRLEEVLGAGTRLPFTARTLVDEQECLDILDQIKVAVPEELKAARRLAQERDQLLNDARAEASRVVREADQQVASRITDHALVRAAEDRAALIEDEALREAEQVRREADEYAYRVLERLRGQITSIEQAVDRGMSHLDAEHDPGPTRR